MVQAADDGTKKQITMNQYHGWNNSDVEAIENLGGGAELSHGARKNFCSLIIHEGCV